MQLNNEPRYMVKKIVNGEVKGTHECYTWAEVEDMKTAISLVKGKATVENINRD